MMHVQPLLAAVPLIQMAIAVGLSLLAGYLLKQKNKATVQDDKPTTLATRGSYVPWVMGIRRIGVVFCWAGGREVRKESSGGGKGFGSSPKVDTYFEDAFHCLCPGPVNCLHRIIENGKVIFEGPITNVSHPSGTLIDLGSVGAFRIFWGEERQPVNTYLGASSRVGVSSRWPFMCYVEWRGKRLGTSPSWQLIDYVVERRPRTDSPILSNTESRILPTRTLDGTTLPLFSVNAVASEIVVEEYVASEFGPKSLMRLSGNAIADQDLEIVDAEEFLFDPGGGAPLEPRTTLTVAEDITGIDTAGTLQAYSQLPDDGINAAHAIGELLFQEWPEGLSLNQNSFDMDSIEDLGTLTLAEDLRTSWIGQEAETAKSIMASGLQDLGMLMPLDVNTGLIKFVTIREPSGTLPVISADLQPKLPELESRLGPAPSDKIIFAFPDREIQFRDMTIAIDDDGQATKLEHQNARSVNISASVNFGTSARITERRSQEEMAHAAQMTLETTRAARKLLPGAAIEVTGFTDVMRIVSVKLDPLTSKVTLGILFDFYGAQTSDFISNPGGASSDILPVEQDIQFRLVELPEILLGAEPQTVIMPRIRAHAQIVSAGLNISGDNVTYVYQGQELESQQGGVLIDALPEDDFYVIENGPTFTALGPDIASVLDLSSDTANWMLGRQLCVIDDEVFYLRNVTAIGGDVYRLDGLVRARYDTRRETHAIGAEVYIVQNDGALPIQDVLVQPNVTLYAKTQPLAGGVMPLGLVAPESLALYGKGIVPVPPGKPYTGSGSDDYETGDDVTINWSYSIPRTPSAGAGHQGAGSAVLPVLPEGSFVLEILTTGDVVVRTESIAVANSYVYDNADLIADLGSEVDFKVRVRQLRDGFTSANSPELLVEKV